jgi:membrane-bound metal-dependent hydrolase YbcI (DUF457 family)
MAASPMNTPSHLIINAAIEKKFGKKLSIIKPAFLWGAVIPDIPFGLLLVGSYVYFGLVLGQDVSNLMDDFIHIEFYINPWWIAAHNFFHAPLILLTAIAISWRFRQRFGAPAQWVLWFSLGSLLHTLIDIPTHSGDGPLLFFPFDWQTRFNSPISYWDPNYFGAQFVLLEIGLNLVLLAYLFIPPLVQRIRRV